MQEAPPSLVIPSPSSSLPSYSCLWEGCHAPLFASEDEVYAHVVAIHAVSGKQICQWSTHPARPPNVNCQTNLRNKGQFVDHISLHFSTALKPFPCQLCTDKFRNRQTLQRHKLAIHQPTTAAESDQYYYSAIDTAATMHNQYMDDGGSRRPSSASSTTSTSSSSNRPQQQLSHPSHQQQRQQQHQHPQQRHTGYIITHQPISPSPLTADMTHQSMFEKQAPSSSSSSSSQNLYCNNGGSSNQRRSSFQNQQSSGYSPISIQSLTTNNNHRHYNHHHQNSPNHHFGSNFRTTEYSPYNTIREDANSTGNYTQQYTLGMNWKMFTKYFNHIGAVSGIVVPKKWTDIAITARDHGGHVPANFQMELDNWFASAHPGILDADTYVNMRISLYYNNSKYFMGEHIAKLIELITHFTEKLVREAERRSSSSLGGMGTLSIGFPSQNNPFRELLLKICSMSWRTYCSYFNDDEGDIVELASSTHQNNCRSSILGLRIMCPAYQSNPLTLELRKLASITYFNLINEVFDRFIGNYVWGGQSNTLAIKRLCCGGFVCRNMSPSSSMNSWSTSIALCTSGPTNHSTGVNGMIPLSKITASVTTSSADTAVNISNSMETSNKDGNDDDNDVAMDDVVVTSTADQQQPLHHAASLQQQQYTPTTSFAFASSSVSANKATSASVQPQSATTPPSTQLPLTRGSIQVVELDHRPGIIVWLRVSIDEDFIRTPPPLKSDPVYLVKSLTNNPL